MNVKFDDWLELFEIKMLLKFKNPQIWNLSSFWRFFMCIQIKRDKHTRLFILCKYEDLCVTLNPTIEDLKDRKDKLLYWSYFVLSVTQQARGLKVVSQP